MDSMTLQGILDKVCEPDASNYCDRNISEKAPPPSREDQSVEHEKYLTSDNTEFPPHSANPFPTDATVPPC